MLKILYCKNCNSYEGQNKDLTVKGECNKRNKKVYPDNNCGYHSEL